MTTDTEPQKLETATDEEEVHNVVEVDLDSTPFATKEDEEIEETTSPSLPTTSPRPQKRVSITAASAPNDKSYHPGALRLFAPPRQRQTWNDTQILPRLNWGDLFFDLFYVAAAYNVS